MSIKKVTVPFLTMGLILASPALAQDAANASSHQWHKPSKEDMAAWHKRSCIDHYARAAGRLAYTEAKLDVTAAQRSAFDRWRAAVLHSAQARKDECLAHQGEHDKNTSVVERSAMMQKKLESRLAALRSEQPALEALYQSLTPEQKTQFDQRGHRFGKRGHGPMQHRGGERQ